MPGTKKIRRQIRDCEYFLPMISAAAEARKECYFRREWRLAAERTLDMADEVMLLPPVLIDGTSESGARVPDKFLAAQWLRLPGGAPTLHPLCRRLLAGKHSAPPRPTSSFTRPPLRTPLTSTPLPPPLASAPRPLDPPACARPDYADRGPPPMPPFPHRPEKGSGHEIKFVAEILW